MYKKECPRCKKEIEYKSKTSLTKSKNRNTLCRFCQKHFQCIKCLKFFRGQYNKQICRSCKPRKIPLTANIKCIKCNKEKIVRIKYKDEIWICGKCKGNHFKGKKHTIETRLKISKANIGRKLTNEHKQKISNGISGKNNPMYGISLYDVWFEKFGKEIADQKLIEIKKKISIKTSGKNNPMYGKPSPQGSGNGWSGWYKGWYFRSLKELSYVINVIEKFNFKWKTAEEKKFKIKYINSEGIERTYIPDFIVNDKYLIEIKPKKLWNSPNIKAKSSAAIEWCKNTQYIYKLRDCPILTDSEIKELHDSKLLKFIDRYEIKYQEKYLKNLK